MNVTMINKKERRIYFFWYILTMLDFAAFFTLTLVINRGYIGKDLLWLVFLLGAFGFTGSIITYLYGRNIQMIQRAGRYREYIANWMFSSTEWHYHTGESIPDDENRNVMLMRKGIIIGKSFHTWTRFKSKLESAEVIGDTLKKSIRLIYSVPYKNSGNGEYQKKNHEIFVPVPDDADVEAAVLRLKKENRIS